MPSHLIKNYGAYQRTANAHNFVEVGQRSLAKSSSFVRRAVENVEVVMIDAVAKKNIGDEYQE